MEFCRLHYCMVNLGSMTDAPATQKFQFVGGDLCLDYCNTVGGKRGAIARDKLHAYADFACWCEQAGLLDRSEAQVLVRRAARRPADAASALARALGLREAIY